MARVPYTAEATVFGGPAKGRGRTTDGTLDVQLRSPKEIGGDGDETTGQLSSYRLNSRVRGERARLTRR
jgi:hypothetical protein